MGYFDDLTILSVRRVTTSIAKTPEASPFMGSLGVMEGKSVIRLIGSRKKQFRPPLVYWSVPGTLLAWSSPAGQIRTNRWVDLCGERAQRFFPELHKLSPDDLLQIDNPVPFLSLLERLDQAGKNNRPQENRVRLIEDFIAEIYAVYRMRLGSRRLDSAIDQTAAAIRSAPGRAFDLQRTARENGVSFEYFRKQFAARCGCPPHEFILRARIEQAFTLLSNTHLGLKEIAEQCGFDTASNFARFFRLRTGIPPSRWRDLRG